MVIDLVMGNAALAIGVMLAIFNARLATLMREGDDGFRDEATWTQSTGPDTAFLESDRGRWWIFRGWLLMSSLGFVTIATGLIARNFV